MPAHTITEPIVVSVSTTPTRIDPNTAGTGNVKRYKVIVINSSPSVRIYVGHTSGVSVASGHCIEADHGEATFFIDSALALWARTESGTADVYAKEYCTV